MYTKYRLTATLALRTSRCLSDMATNMITYSQLQQWASMHNKVELDKKPKMPENHQWQDPGWWMKRATLLQKLKGNSFFSPFLSKLKEKESNGRAVKESFRESIQNYEERYFEEKEHILWHRSDKYLWGWFNRVQQCAGFMVTTTPAEKVAFFLRFPFTSERIQIYHVNKHFREASYSLKVAWCKS